MKPNKNRKNHKNHFKEGLKTQTMASGPSAFALTGWFYAKLIRLHDIIYFIWRAKGQLSWVGLKVVAVLAGLGFLMAVVWETVQEYMPHEALPALPPKKMGPTTAAWSTRPKFEKLKDD